MHVKRSLLSVLVAALLVFGLGGSAMAWGTNELDTEKIAVTFAREVQRGEYKVVATTDKNRLIVFYCGFVKCTRSHNGAMWATKLGYKNVYRHPGGIKAWAETDYPVAKVK